ncbi:hypothetical protein [Ferruginibacter sp. HRS2-29]|uniref:hypothetical protein n=1 Tax=Ferruginibacter sp. HRS2-29 TaxID=2487334 RepID=UPI0020CDC036|nr:hypothetical protein [Ferruginibacter sp. HRS2-29]
MKTPTTAKMAKKHQQWQMVIAGRDTDSKCAYSSALILLIVMVIIERDEENYKRFGSPIDERDLIYFLQKQITPNFTDFYGQEYCAAVSLNDGTILPCVVFRHKRKMIDLIYGELHKKRLSRGVTNDRPHDREFVQKNIIEHHLVAENIVRFNDEIIKVEKCKFAMPEEILKKINGEPAHFFLAKFKDGSYENFRIGEGPFYEVPIDKELEGITEVFNSTLMLQNGEIISIEKLADWKTHEADLKKIHCSKPYFACYVGHSDYNDLAENIENVKERWT